MQNETFLNAYQRELVTVRDAKPNTVRAYLHHVNSLATALQTRGRTLLDATRDDLLAWREGMVRKPRGAAQAVAAVRGFYNWMVDAGHVVQSPLPAGMKVSVKYQEPTDVPTVHQFLEMRAAVDRPYDGRLADRVTRRALVEVLAGAGLRIEALLTLRPEHLHLADLRRPSILVNASEMSCKGKTAGTVPISWYAAETLRSYLKLHPVQPGSPVFPYSGKVVRRILTHVQPAGMRLKPHSLRHFYCSMTYFKNFDGGKNDLIWVRDAAGHSNVATTNNYLKLARRVCQDEEAWTVWAYGSLFQAQAMSA